MATYSGSDKRLQYLFQHGGGGSLDDLDDVEITNPTDGDALVYDGEEEKWVNGEGGGGNANEQVLTKAEYDALTEEQKMNNTTYYINDADTWTSKEVQPVIYSTEEREVGVWTDGKPLYQKTVHISSVPSNAYDTIPMNISNIDKCVEYKGIVHYSNGIYEDFNYSRPDGTNSTFYTAITSNGDFFFRSYEAITAQAWVTIQYTKTTDQAGSGIYTPQGQLAVHYSTEEHVIGTWIDGSTLYETTISLGQLAYDTSWHTVAHNIANIDIVVYLQGIAINQAKETFSMNMARPTVTTGIIIDANATGIDYMNNFLQNSSGYVTIRYTKSA